MQLEDYFEFEKHDTKFGPVERIRIKGHRISIENVMEFINQGCTPEEVVQRHYPSLTLEEVQATVDYCRQNRDRVEEYMRRGDEVADKYYQEYLQQEPPPVVRRLRELKKQRSQANGSPND